MASPTHPEGQLLPRGAYWCLTPALRPEIPQLQLPLVLPPWVVSFDGLISPASSPLSPHSPRPAHLHCSFPGGPTRGLVNWLSLWGFSGIGNLIGRGFARR